MKETGENNVKCMDKKPFVFGFIAGIAFVFIVVAISGDEETGGKEPTTGSLQVGRYVDIETTTDQTEAYMFDTATGDTYSRNVLGENRNWRRVSRIEDNNTSAK